MTRITINTVRPELPMDIKNASNKIPEGAAVGPSVGGAVGGSVGGAVGARQPVESTKVMGFSSSSA